MMNFRTIVLVSITVCLSVALISQAYAQWKPTNGPRGGSFETIIVKDNDLFIGSSGAGIFKSTDGGNNWRTANNGLTQLFISSLAIDTANIFVSTTEGIFRSNNGGDQWVQVNNGLPCGIISGRIISQAGYLYVGNPSGGVFFSTDEGENWDTSGLINIGITQIAADDSSTVIAINGSHIYRSSDQGLNWSKADSGNIASYKFSISFMNGSWVAATDSGIIFSRDKGLSWKCSTMDSIFTGIFTLAQKGDTLYAGGNYLLRSLDTGKTWRIVGAKPSGAPWISSMVTRNDGIFALAGGVYFTDNEGGNWLERDSNVVSQWNYHLVLNGSTLYSVSNKISFTSDRGFSWKDVKGEIENYFPQDLLIIGEDMFVATTRAGVFRSPNFGISWSSVNNGLTSLHASSFASNHDTIYVSTTDSGTFWSTDLGSSWFTMNRGLNRGGLFVDKLLECSGHLFALSNNLLWEYGDSTSGWILIDGGHTFPPMLVYTVAGSDSVLYASTNYGSAFSTDVGKTWIRDTSAIFNNLNVQWISVLDKYIFVGTLSNQNGVACARLSTPDLYFTSDLGIHWESIYDGLPFTYPVSFAMDSEFIYVGTGGAGVWRRPLLEVIAAVEQISGIKPSQFLLQQNFPNPFNPSTTIQFSIPHESHVTLKIYNLLGQEVQTLVNDNRTAGTYEVQFDGSKLPSGVYYYRLSGGDYVATKSMLVIK